MTRLAKGLADAGFAAMRFDFTGLGESDGDFAASSVSGNVSDLTRAAANLIGMGFGPCGLIGHSLGGAAAVLATHRLKTVRSLVTIGAPSDTGHVRHLFSGDLDRLKTEGRATVSISGREFELERGFISDLECHDVLVRAGQLARPYMVVHAEDDEVVGIEHGERLYKAASHPKKFVRLKTGGHLFGPRDASEKMVDAVVGWFNQSL